MNRARTACEREGRCSHDDSRYYNFSRLFVYNGEHTWGGDIKAFLHPDEILLTVDAMTGQDIVNVAQSFHDQLEQRACRGEA